MSLPATCRDLQEMEVHPDIEELLPTLLRHPAFQIQEHADYPGIMQLLEQHTCKGPCHAGEHGSSDQVAFSL